MKYEKGTFVIVPNIQHLKKFAPEAVSLFIYLCSYSDDSGICFPSRTRLSRDMNVTVKTVDKYLSILIENGLITKTIRKDSGTGGNKSNLYQVEVLDSLPSGTKQPYPSEFKDPTPSVPNDILTISNINYTQLTKDTQPTPEVIKTGQLPLTSGRTYIDRVLKVYNILFRNLYGFSPTISIPRFGKELKKLLESKSEVQVSALLIAFFDWAGMDGRDDRERSKLVASSHNPFWFFSTVNQYEAKLRNVDGLDIDNEDTVKDFVAKSISSIKK